MPDPGSLPMRSRTARSAMLITTLTRGVCAGPGAADQCAQILHAGASTADPDLVACNRSAAGSIGRERAGSSARRVVCAPGMPRTGARRPGVRGSHDDRREPTRAGVALGSE